MRRFAVLVGLVASAAALSVSCGGSDATAPSGGFVPAEHTPFPMLVNNGGRVMSSMRLVVIVPSNHDRSDSLFMFATSLSSSTWERAVDQPYGVAMQPSVSTIVGPPLTDSGLATTAFATYVRSAIAERPDLAPDGQTLYLIFAPIGVTVALPFCGYHNAFDSIGDALAIVTYCGASRTLAGLTSLASHEIAEAASDPMITAWNIPINLKEPWLTTPWAMDDGTAGREENGDLCNSTRFVDGPFTYQRIWSNAAATAGGDPCLPVVNAPYYNVSGQPGWYTTSNGVAQIVFTGWSTAPIEHWIVTAFTEASNVTPTLSIAADDSIIAGSRTFRAVNNGKTVTLTVTFPPGTASSAYAAIRVLSQRLDASGNVRAGEDIGHGWVVGVYVP